MNFGPAVKLIFQLEGGYADQPADDGGKTKYGITAATLAGYLGTPVTEADMRALDQETARAIYLRNYWVPLACDELPLPLAVCLFDAGVNHGVGLATRLLQQALGVKVDGVLGPITLSVADAQGTSPGFLGAFMARRALLYIQHADFPTFGKGWLRRLFLVYHHAALATGDTWPDTEGV